MTIRLKMMSLVASLVIAASLAQGALFGVHLKKNLEDIAIRHTTEAALLLGQQLTELLGLGIPVNQILGFEEQCKAVLERNRDLTYAYVTDRTGTILFHNDKAVIGSPSHAIPSNAETDPRPKPNTDLVLAGTHYIETALPVDHAGKTVATIHVGISYGYVTARLIETFKIPAVMFAVLLAVCVVASFGLFQKFVGGPLRMLTEGIEAFANTPDGKAAKIKVSGNDELGIIAASFNDMVDSIDANITRRKNAEQELVDLNARLEARIEERTNQLLASTQAAKDASNAKSEFLSHMSHELRTPLNSIIGYADAMKHRIRGDLPAAYEDYAAMIVKSGEVLLGTINAVLDLSKIEAGQFELLIEPTEVSEVVHDALAVLDIQARDRGVYLRDKTRFLPRLDVDELRVKQAFVNIVGNAIKFTETGGVEVTDELDADGYRIVVSDTGIGMSGAQVQRALEPFSQVHGTSLSRQFQGTGLGLSYSHQIMLLHGGRLAIESQPGEGTRVTLFFASALTANTISNRAV